METISNQRVPLSTMEMAALGLKKVETADMEEKEATCDFFLRKVESQGDEQEKAIARCALALSSKGEKDSGAFLAIKTSILGSISRGVSGPMGTAIGRIAIENIDESPFDSMPQVAQTFVKALEEHGTDYEREIASSSLALAGKNATMDQREGYLKLLDMAAKGLPPTAAAALADVGLSMMSGASSCISKGAGADVGARFLNALAEKGNEAEKTITAAVMKPFPGKIASDETLGWEAYNAISLALTSIATGAATPVAACLIDIASKVSAPYVSSILETLSKDTKDPALSAVTGALNKALAELPQIIRERVEDSAFSELKKGSSSTVDAALVRHALKARESASYAASCYASHTPYKDTYRAEIGTPFLKAMAEHASIPENRRIAEETLQATVPGGFFGRLFSKDDHEIVEIQSRAFKSMMDNLKAKDLEANLERELEKSIAQRVLGQEDSNGPVNAPPIDVDDQFIEVDGIKLSKKQWELLK